MKDEFLSQQQATTDLRVDVNLLKADVVSIHSSQGEISEQVGDVQKAVLDLGKQLAAMSFVLKTLQPQSSRNAEKQLVTEDLEHVKSRTLQQGQLEQHNTRTEVIRKQMELEKELNRHCDNLPPIRINRPYVAPGLRKQQPPDGVNDHTPTAPSPGQANTPAFNQFNQSRERQLWQGYFKTNEQEMKAQFHEVYNKRA